MGSYLFKSFGISSEKQREFSLGQMQVNCERQLQIQRQMAEKQMAMRIAVGREQLKYFGSFYALTGVGLLAAFLVAYQYDVAYGTFPKRVLGEAENVITSENHRLDLPFGPVTFDSIETARVGVSSSSEKRV